MCCLGSRLELLWAARLKGCFMLGLKRSLGCSAQVVLHTGDSPIGRVAVGSAVAGPILMLCLRHENSFLLQQNVGRQPSPEPARAPHLVKLWLDRSRECGQCKTTGTIPCGDGRHAAADQHAQAGCLDTPQLSDQASAAVYQDPAMHPRPGQQTACAQRYGPPGAPLTLYSCTSQMQENNASP